MSVIHVYISWLLLLFLGGGAMVAIDFEDGSSALVSGLDETLLELGLTPNEEETVKEEPAIISEASSAAVANDDDKEKMVDPAVAMQAINESVEMEESKVKVEIAAKVPVIAPSEKEEKAVIDHGAVDRMRATATKDDNSLGNPWLNAASYLAKKAGEKMFSRD